MNSLSRGLLKIHRDDCTWFYLALIVPSGEFCCAFRLLKFGKSCYYKYQVDIASLASTHEIAVFYLRSTELRFTFCPTVHLPEQ